MASVIHEQIIELYGRDILRKSAINIRDGAGVFERVLGGRDYKTVLEIGTYRGVAAAEMAQYCDRVITIDLKHGKLQQAGETFDRAKFWRSLAIDNIDFYEVENDAEKAHLVSRLEFDFAFIDGAHDETIKNDFELVSRCGHVLFHDYDDRGQPALNHVFDFVNSLPRHQVEILDIFALWIA